MAEYTLSKAERLNSKAMIERLFAGGNKSFRLSPCVWCICGWMLRKEAPVSILISVPKKRFKRAVKRNLVKRRVREAYRKNKQLLTDALVAKNKRLVLAFIWLDNEIHPSAEIEGKVKRLLFHIMEKIE